MKLRIWHKMIIGISIPSLIAVLGGIFSYGYINDVKIRQGFVQIADDLKEQVLEIRRNEKNFLLFKDTIHLESLHNAISVFSSSVKNISPETSAEIGESGLPLLNTLIRKYSDITINLSENYNNEAMISNTVRAEGKKLGNLTTKKKLAIELSTSFVLHLRLLEKNYMFFRDKKSYLELNRGLSQIRNMTPICYDCDPYISAVRSLFTVFEKSDSIINSLQNTGNNLEKITGIFALREREKISSFITFTQRLLLTGLILLCIIGPLFVYKTASYIVAPIKRLADIIKKIDAGDLSLRAPLKEHDETHTLAISFNTMLDHLQQTQESLEKSMDLLQEKQVQLVESEKRASLGFLVSGVAHELNNPLNNISLTAETMNEDLEDLSTEELSSYLNDILMQSERAHSVVQSLLEFASARKSTGMEKQDIVRVVKDSIKLIGNQLRVNNIKLKQDFPEKVYFVNANRSKLEQVFVSIINNAVYAMEAKGTLTVTIIPDDEEKNVLIKLHDTGHGISDENIKNLFEPFFTTKPPGDGTGLGLSVSYTLVKEHQGNIEVESKVGEGTTFTVVIPISSRKESIE
jgi:signal transduction histidine kinase